jgi:hypothetical protein
MLPTRGVNGGMMAFKRTTGCSESSHIHFRLI